MGTRDAGHRETLFSDVPGDAEKVRAILAEWGVEEPSIRRLMRDGGPAAAVEADAREEGREPRPTRHAGH